MKKFVCAIVSLLCIAAWANEENGDIQLPQPNLKGNVSLKSAFKERRTSRTFSRKDLSALDISNLLWAANGVNRDNGKLTIPAARGIYTIELYVALSDGVYKHNRETNVLQKVVSKDLRSASDSRKMGAQAPVVVVMVADQSKFGEKGAHYVAMEAGAIMQNLYLYCAGYKLGTVVCGSFDKNVWAKELKLPADKYVILTQVVGCMR